MANSVNSRHRVRGFRQYIKEVMTTMAANGYGYQDGDTTFVKNPDLSQKILIKHEITVAEYKQNINATNIIDCKSKPF